MSAQMPYIDFGGEGHILHFAHANAFPPGAYRQFLTALTGDFHVLAQEQRPLWEGASPRQMESWHLFTDDLIAFADAHRFDGVVGVGHSLGAVVTMAAAVRRPELFSKLVLIEPVFLLPEILAMAASNPDMAYKIPMVRTALKRRNRWTDREAAFTRFRSKDVFSRVADEALWDYVRAGLYDLPDGRAGLRFPRAWEARIYSRPPANVWELLPQVTQPTLAVRAAETDTIWPAAWGKWQELQPRATFVEVAGATHLLPLERPQELATIVRAYLQGS